MQLQHRVSGKVLEGSGTFRRVPEGSGADTCWGSGGFRCRYLVKFWRVPAQIPGEVPEGSGADTW